ncbi:CNNM domain-containing protein, partial [Staphylococcus epidermidis]|uniref:CNNM domain-containing protein n=1 Tax=Staphylococcus epidermidis TaxID=1282 RepID=UPI0011A3B6A4
IHNLHYYLSPSQLPITLTSLPLPSLPQPTFQNMIHPLFHLLHLPTPLTTTISFLLSFILLTYLHLVLPQFPPKSFPIQHTQQLPLLYSTPLFYFPNFIKPLISLINASS